MAAKLALTLAALSTPFAVVLGVALALSLTVPSVTLTVDRTTYAIGDTVHFTLRNGLHDPVYLTCSAPWRVLRDVSGVWQPVEEHACLGIIVEVTSGSTRNWTWVATTQSAPGLAQVLPGSYRVDLVVLTGCDPSKGGCQTIHLTTFFRLV